MQPDRQADFAERINYGPTNPKAYEFIREDVANLLPSNPKYKDVVLPVDPIWGGDNRAKRQLFQSIPAAPTPPR